MTQEKVRRVTDFKKSVLLMIPEAIHDRLRLVVLELAEHYDVETDLEIFALQELAVSRYRLAELNHQWNSLVNHERDEAFLTFERLRNKQYVSELRQWRNHPVACAETLGQSWSGARHFSQTWHCLAEQLTEGMAGPSLEVMCEAVMSLGFTDRIGMMAEEAWWFMSRFLAVHSDPELMIKAWVKRSKSSDRQGDEQRAAKRWADAPEAATARRELLDKARENARLWEAKAQALKRKYEADRSFYRDSIGGPAVDDKRLASSRRTLQSFQKYEAGRVKDLEKRLERAISDRVKAEQEVIRDAERQSRLAQKAISNPDKMPARPADQAKPPMARAGEAMPYVAINSGVSESLGGIQSVIVGNPMLPASGRALREMKRSADETAKAVDRKQSRANQPSSVLISPMTSVAAP